MMEHPNRFFHSFFTFWGLCFILYCSLQKIRTRTNSSVSATAVNRNMRFKSSVKNACRIQNTSAAKNRMLDVINQLDFNRVFFILINIWFCRVKIWRGWNIFCLCSWQKESFSRMLIVDNCGFFVTKCTKHKNFPKTLDFCERWWYIYLVKSQGIQYKKCFWMTFLQ